MNESKLQSAPFVEMGALPNTAPRRVVLTIGNVSVYEIGRRLSIGWQHSHLPNWTWPSLGGDAIPLARELNDPIFDRIRKEVKVECDKSLVPHIRARAWDVLVMSTATHVGATYAVDGDKCIPDFTEPPWLTDIDLAGEKRPAIHQFVPQGTRRVNWLDEDFLPLAKRSFDRAYERTLKRKVKLGGRVFILRQMPTQWAIAPRGLERQDFPDFAAMERLSTALAQHASRFKGVTVIDTPEALNFTSEDAPGGLGPFNPIEEHYVYLACKIADAMGDSLSEALVQHHLLEMRRERIALEWQVTGNTRQREKDLEAIIRSLIDRGAMLERELLATKRTLSWRVTKPLRSIRRIVRRPAPKAP